MTALERNSNSVSRADEFVDDNAHATTAAVEEEEEAKVFAPETIPCCVRPFLQLVYYNLLRPTDGYLTRVRKAWLLIAVIIGTITPIIGFRILREHPDDPAAVAYAVSCFIMVAWHVLHAYVRYTRRMSNAATFIAVNIASVAVVMSVPLTVDFPHAPILMLLMQFCGMLATPFFVPNMAFLVIATAVGYFNIAAIARGSFDASPLMVNGVFFQTFSDRLPRYLLVTAAAVGTAMLGRFMVSEFQRITVRSGRSAATAAIVTALLRRYNTERARVVLEAAAMPFELDTSAVDSDVVDPIAAIDALGPHATAEELTPFLAGADPRLLESLTEMVHNLNTYRGHLPNWLLDAAMKSNENSDEELDPASLSAIHDLASDDCRSQLGRSAASQHSGGSSSRYHNESIRRSATGSDPALKAPEGLVARHVARARVDIRFPSKDRIAVATQLALVNTLIDRVLAIARSTHGAVHTFLGDSIQLSWNAAAPVAQPDVKAVRFLARARAVATSMVDDHAVVSRSPQPAAPMHQVDGSGVTAGTGTDASAAAVDDCLVISGVAITGATRVAMAGTGIQRMLYINADGSASALGLAATLAQRTGSFLCDGASAEAAIDVVTRGMAAVSCAGKAQPMELHEVIAENAAGATDEWLYVVRDMQNAGNPHETCTALLRSVLQEPNFAGARALADKIPAEYITAPGSGSTALARQLLDAARCGTHKSAVEKLVLSA